MTYNNICCHNDKIFLPIFVLQIKVFYHTPKEISSLFYGWDSCFDFGKTYGEK